MSAGLAVFTAAVVGGTVGLAALVVELRRGEEPRLFLMSLAEPWVMLAVGVSRHSGFMGASG